MADRPVLSATSEPAFRTFAVDPPYAARTLRAQLTKRRDELIGQLGGSWCQDWADYCKRKGVIEGLAEAIDFCAEMEKKGE